MKLFVVFFYVVYKSYVYEIYGPTARISAFGVTKFGTFFKLILFCKENHFLNNKRF